MNSYLFYRSLHNLLEKSELLIEPGSTVRGPKIGVTFSATYYAQKRRTGKIPPFSGCNAGVFLTKPG